MKYNPNYYHNNKLHQLRPRREAIHTFKTSEGILIGVFQGSRGSHPEIDFVVRILKPGKGERPFPPLHSFWVVDLMMKTIDFRKEVIEILNYYIHFYETVEPFQNQQERADFSFKTVELITQKYAHINQEHTLSLDYVCMIIELFCINEKRNEGAYMFYNLLNTLLSYAKKEVDYISVIQASQPGFR
ncbi:MAG: hypothetical protein WDA08_05745 [Weeksellaceae bacterium]